MALVKDLLAYRNTHPVCVSPNDTVLHALQVMAQENIGAVLVVEGHKVLGIFTERDYARKGEVAGRTAAHTLVKEMMTSELISVTSKTSLEECLKLMQTYHIRHLPVVDGERVIGILSIRDVMEAVLKERESEIVGLENYIIGSSFQM
ncbi:MAG: CBS domain-containing protein [Chloroflexi bacterium]|jgi:CBS domain-containing protein|nr:CBS domain-containing protein [Chloroflexota bacterium]